MAEAKTEEAPKGKSKLLLLIIIGVVVLAVAAVGAILLLKKPAAEDGEDGEAPAAAKQEKKKPAQPLAPPAYLKLDTFTSNLASEGNDQSPQYIQVVVELRLPDAHEAEALKPYTPEIRNAVLRLLSSRKASQLITLEGKDALAEDIRKAVNVIVNPPRRTGSAPDEPVETVVFSSFIIQ